MNFLSERNTEMHKEYLNTLLCRYKIFEKSYPELLGKDIAEIHATKIMKSEREAAIKLLSEILAHKMYFSSFGERGTSSLRVIKEYGSIAAFLYEIRKKCRECDFGFMIVYEDRGKIGLYCGAAYENIFINKKVFLALDLCEHSYFYDYGFSKEDYVMNAISHFDLSKI